MQNGSFPFKIALLWKKVCYKVSLCENRQRHSCKAFVSLSIRAKMIGGERPLLCENLAETDPFKNADFELIFVRSTSAVKPSAKSAINTNTKSSTGFPVSLR